MFAIQPQQQTTGSKDNCSETCAPNILPCKIHYDGPVKSVESYWVPTPDAKDENVQSAYFRGRKLRGRRVTIPEGYEGVVVAHSDRVMPKTHDVTEGAEEGDGEEPVNILEKRATFNDYVVWGHETLPAADDSFVKGVEEWVKLAEAIHSQPKQEKNPSA